MSGSPTGAISSCVRMPGPVRTSGRPPSKASISTTSVVERSGYSCVPCAKSQRFGSIAPFSTKAKRAFWRSSVSDAPALKASQAGKGDALSAGVSQTGVS